MTPLPFVPGVIKFRFHFNFGSNYRGGFGLYWRYNGSAPGGADMDNLCSGLAGIWNTHFSSFLSSAYTLIQVSGLDLSSATGASGQKTVSWQGTDSNPSLAIDTCTLVNFQIDRHYRGGKPRVYLPIGTQTSLQDPHSWTTAYTAAVLSAFEAMVTAFTGFQSNLVTMGAHCNVGYYSGFTVVTDPVTGRARNHPTKLATPHNDPISGYTVPTPVGSQRRRVLATGK